MKKEGKKTMKTNCDIIRDLLPLYVEHITK